MWLIIDTFFAYEIESYKCLPRSKTISTKKMTIFEHYYFCIAIWLSQLFPNVLITVLLMKNLCLCFVIFPLFSTVIVITVSPLSCVSCVPASCVLIWFVSCPRFLWLLVNSCPAVFVSLSMIILCIYSPVCSVWFGQLITPRCSCLCQPWTVWFGPIQR